MESKYFNRYRSFLKSFDNLLLSRNADINAPFVLSGTVQNYNLTFDLSWKVMKELLTQEFGINDFATGSPRETLKAAFSIGLIDDDYWLKMLRMWNNLAHDYDGRLAELYFEEIVTSCMNLFRKFIDRIEKYYKNES